MQIDLIAKKVAQELNLIEEQVRLVNRVQWKFLTEVMKKGELEPVKILYLGKFLKNKTASKNEGNNRRLEECNNKG